MTTENDPKAPSHTTLIRDYILSLIEQKHLNQQSKLPSERVLCERFAITRITLRQALTQLETEGLIYRQHHKGWFVSPPRILYDPTKNLSFTEFVLKQHREPHNRILLAERHDATAWEKNSLELPEDEQQVYHLRRLRSVDGRAVMVEHLHINAARCNGLLECPIEQSVTEVLRKHYGIVISRSSVRLHSTALTESQAKDLNVASGTPSIYVIRTNYDQHGNIIEVDQEFWRHDALEITANSEQQNELTVPASGLSQSLNQLVGEYAQLAKHYQQQLAGLTDDFDRHRKDSQQQINNLKSRLVLLESDD